MGVFEDYEKAVWDADHDNCTLGELEEAEQRLKDSIFEWIPVTERLPEDSGEYLVTLFDGTIEIRYYLSTIRKWFPKTDMVAWMPLPNSYEEGA